MINNSILIISAIKYRTMNFKTFILNIILNFDKLWAVFIGKYEGEYSSFTPGEIWEDNQAFT